MFSSRSDGQGNSLAVGTSLQISFSWNTLSSVSRVIVSVKYFSSSFLQAKEPTFLFILMYTCVSQKIV